MKFSGETKKTIVGLLVCVIGIVLMVTGARNGEMQVVLEKAINICMECIGIG